MLAGISPRVYAYPGSTYARLLASFQISTIDAISTLVEEFYPPCEPRIPAKPKKYFLTNGGNPLDQESFSTAFRNLLFFFLSFFLFFSSPSIRRKGRSGGMEVTSSDSDRATSKRSGNREGKQKRCITYRKTAVLFRRAQLGCINSPFVHDSSFPSSPLSLSISLLFLFHHARPVNPGTGGGKKTRNESKQSSIDNVCAVRLTVRIVFPRSPSSSPFFFHATRTIVRESMHAHTSSQLTPRHSFPSLYLF